MQDFDLSSQKSFLSGALKVYDVAAENPALVVSSNKFLPYERFHIKDH